MPLRRRRGLPVLTLSRLVPNALTLVGLCAGLTAVRLALLERWELAIAAIVLAMVMDALDGKIARLMGVSSEFGAQLDSLADAISFGVAPALIVYLWSLTGAGGIGWALALVFAVACTLRLARFNVNLGGGKPFPWAERFFTGVPAPAGGGTGAFAHGSQLRVGRRYFGVFVVQWLYFGGGRGPDGQHGPDIFRQACENTAQLRWLGADRCRHTSGFYNCHALGHARRDGARLHGEHTHRDDRLSPPIETSWHTQP